MAVHSAVALVDRSLVNLEGHRGAVETDSTNMEVAFKVEVVADKLVIAWVGYRVAVAISMAQSFKSQAFTPALPELYLV